jgi:hypothetical protein
MAIFRGIGGAGDSTTDATVTAVTEQAVNAATSATQAASSASSAASSASAAATSATNAENAYDSFDDRYLGVKASDPALDNDGAALLTGALYFNSTDNEMRVYTGSVWIAVVDLAGDVTVTSLTASGTVTADGLAVSGASTPTFKVTNTTAGSTGSPQYTELLFEGYNNEDRATIKVADTANSGNFGFLEIHTQNTSNVVTRRLNINSGGDISFYEDTGTTPKLFWDASAESLSIGSTASTTDRVFQVTGTATSSATTQFGIVVNPTFPTAVTGTLYNLYTSPNLTSGTTLTNLYNIYLDANNKTGSTVTNSYGLYQAGSGDKNYFAGNVGIGTTSPDASMGPGLHIKSASGNSLILEKDTGAAIQFRSDASTIRATILGINGADGLTIATGAAQTERMRITSSGNVGIGTTTPAAALDVTGTVNATTVNTTNIEVTNIKAKDGTSAGSIADSTGVVTLASSVLTTADINGGTIDGVTMATSDITVGAGKTLDVSAGTLTLANDQISGDKIQGGTIGSTTITTLTSTTGNITNVNATTVDTTNIEVTNVKAKDGTASATIADSTGVMTIASSVLTTTDINGGTIDGVTIGGTSAGAITGTTITGTQFSSDATDVELKYSGSTKLATTSSGVDVTGTVTITQSTGDTFLKFDVDGTTDEATLGIDSTDFVISNDPTNVRFGSDIVFKTDGITAAKVRASGDFELYEDTGTTAKFFWDASAEHLKFSDSVEARFGDNSEFRIYHDTSDTYLVNFTQGNIYLKQETNDKDVVIQSDDGSGGITDYFVADGSTGEAILYHYGSEKLATKSTGIDVTGTVTADGLTVDGLAQISAQTNGSYALRIGDAEGNSGSVIGVGKLGINPQGASTFTYTGTEIRATEFDAGDYRAHLSFYTRNDTSDLEPKERIKIASTGDISFYEDTGTSQNFYWDASTSRLGLGTTSPSEALHVQANTSEILSDGTNNTQSALVAGVSVKANNFRKAGFTIYDESDNEDFFIGRPYASTNQFVISNDTTDRLRINNAGDFILYADDGTSQDFYWDASTSRLGIGTTSPGADIHVSKAVPNIRWADSGASGVNQIYQSGSSFVLDCDPTNLDASSKIIFKVDNSEQMRIDSSGRLGIGTTAPLSDIHIAKSAPIIRMQDTDNDSYAMIMYNTASGGLLLRSDANQATGTTGSNIIFETDGSEAMRIDSSGRLGIGTTSPETMLHLSSSSGSIIRLQDQDASAESNSLIGALEFYSLESENVGEGVKAAVRGYNSSTNGNGQLRFYTGNTTSNDNEVMRIDSSGNLLVGKTVIDINTVGTEIRSNGRIQLAVDGDDALRLNRLNSDGRIADFRKDGTTVGSIGIVSGTGDNLYITGDSTHGGLQFGTDLVTAAKNGAPSDATVNLGNGSHRWKNLYLSGGVYLGGTGSANLLDDYEEGTWTPTLAFGGASTGITYTSRDGHYIKIGKQVTLHGSIILSSKGSSTGAATIESLPFTVGNNLSGTTLEAGGIVSYSENFTGAVATGGISVSATDGTTELKLKELQQSGTTTNDLEEYNFQNTTTFRFSITYFT